MPSIAAAAGARIGGPGGRGAGTEPTTMIESPSPGSSGGERPADDRLESWKEIAAYMRRDVTTVQRWERREAMPVHRHVHDKMGSVYAFKTDLDAWARTRTQALGASSEQGPETEPESTVPTQPVPTRAARRPRWITGLALA